jgi:hypothetical protein
MNYFEHCQSVEEAKKRYRELLMQYRPNNCGDSMSRTIPHNVAWAGANKIRCTERNQQRRSDHAGPEGEAATVEIINQFNSFLNSFMSHSFNSYYEDKEWKPGPDAVTPFQEILQKIINLDDAVPLYSGAVNNIPIGKRPKGSYCQIEIIGYWIYCFKSYEVHEQLKDLGFWFSSKHKAWVYSGRTKRLRAGKETLDEIRARSDFSPRAAKKLKRRNRSKRKNIPQKLRFSPKVPACAGVFPLRSICHDVTSIQRSEIQLFLRNGNRALFVA